MLAVGSNKSTKSEIATTLWNKLIQMRTSPRTDEPTLSTSPIQEAEWS